MGKNMKKKKIAILIIVIIAGSIIALTIDIKLKYDISLFDYAKYNSKLTAAEELSLRKSLLTLESTRNRHWPLPMNSTITMPGS